MMTEKIWVYLACGINHLREPRPSLLIASSVVVFPVGTRCNFTLSIPPNWTISSSVTLAHYVLPVAKNAH
jgi:hypothetical protein